jgi:hypothetical protein
MSPRSLVLGGVAALAGGSALLTAGCAAFPRVLAHDAEALRNKSLRIAVLDVAERSGAFDAAVLQAELAQRLRDLGYERAETFAEKAAAAEWDPARAAGSARARGADAALAVAVVARERGAPARRGPEEESLYSDVGGRREYYRKDLYGEGYKGPRVIAAVTLVQARTGAVLYRAEAEAAARDLSEETLAALLLRPLED